MTVRTKMIIVKCMAFPICLITTPVFFIAFGLKGIIEVWKLFIGYSEEDLRSEVENVR